MTTCAPRAARNAIVGLVLLALVAAALLSPSAGAARQTGARPSPGLRVVQIANRLTGVPYRWGGASPQAGFDCSGLVQYVYGKLGIPLPHNAAAQYGLGRPVARGDLRAGDLVFFYGLRHVGIYAGEGKYIHAPRRGTTVRWSRLWARGGYEGARRLLAA